MKISKMTPNKGLVKFIKKARKKGYDDYEIRGPLVKQGWPLSEIEAAFNYLKRKQRTHYHFKNKVTIYLNNELLGMIRKRAKRNLLTLPEQIEDILRRSCLSFKSKRLGADNIDDLLVKIFSRRKKKGKKR